LSLSRSDTTIANRNEKRKNDEYVSVYNKLYAAWQFDQNDLYNAESYPGT